MMQDTAYEAPKLTVVGSFEDVTKATNTGAQLDGTYVAGTPVAGHLRTS